MSEDALSPSADVYDIALAFVAEKYASKIEKYNIGLTRAFLISLHGQLQNRQRSLRPLIRKDPSLRSKAAFKVARTWVLDRNFLQLNAKEQTERRIYSSALGKVISELRKQSPYRPRPKQERTDLQRLMDHVISEPGIPQSRFDL